MIINSHKIALRSWTAFYLLAGASVARSIARPFLISNVPVYLRMSSLAYLMTQVGVDLASYVFIILLSAGYTGERS